jgi:chlorite dismutase
VTDAEESMSEPSRHPAPAADGGAARRQYVRYLFLKVDPAWRGLRAERQQEAKRAFERAVTAFADRMLIRAYSTVGTRGDADLLLWQVSPNLENFQQLASAIYGTPLGPYLRTPYAYLAMTKRSIYEIPGELESGTNRHLTIEPGPATYLFIYPFVKTRAWYGLPFEQRQALMDQHIVVGRKYPSVKLNTTYSFGLDDQEFVVAFETDEPGDFLDLVMALRETGASAYTERDVPIFTCIATTLRGALDALGSSQAAVAHAAADHPAPHAAAPPVPPDPDGWAAVLAPADLPAGTSRVVFAHDDQVALFHLGDGQLYAISNRCSHARGPLADGPLDDCIVTCPWHGGRFDICTGRAVGAPAIHDVPAYEVRIHDGRIQLRPQPISHTRAPESPNGQPATPAPEPHP